MENSIHNPHDKLFKQSFTQKEVAVGFLQDHLPPAVLKHLNLDKLEIFSGDFVDEKLKGAHSDLIYKIQLKSKKSLAEKFAFLFLLFEHQSTQDPLLAYRFLISQPSG